MGYSKQSDQGVLKTIRQGGGGVLKAIRSGGIQGNPSKGVLDAIRPRKVLKAIRPGGRGWYSKQSDQWGS